jgi:hypothetical protein
MFQKQEETRNLRHDFSAVEVHDLSVKLANKNKEKVLLEGEQKSVQSQYASKLKVITSEINILANQVSDGWELREVEVEIEFHKPTKGMKTITRKDNGLSMTERMESYEWNLFTQVDDEPEVVEGTATDITPKKERKKRGGKKAKGIKALLAESNEAPAEEEGSSDDAIQDVDFEEQQNEEPADESADDQANDQQQEDDQQEGENEPNEDFN